MKRIITASLFAASATALTLAPSGQVFACSDGLPCDDEIVIEEKVDSTITSTSFVSIPPPFFAPVTTSTTIPATTTSTTIPATSTTVPATTSTTSTTSTTIVASTRPSTTIETSTSIPAVVSSGGPLLPATGAGSILGVLLTAAVIIAVGIGLARFLR